ncbi:condensin complex non-SMC subunit Cnd1 [Coemansia sp. RSA 989]|nr:non-SMC mitotic condensation complex subunit 1-domain-containing protein [Coemansia mojavensis]KAJ1741761.1 condensin complex non-SMC subunit Cnd1 [Coemansia sp. RSA 1086]KAJ1748030.1 condensin complex non-SMC subunit Cnd1 [Coemansia sp. RSA 1821]KAJ1864594.1 condensin complex non-SMC subunit Cnd1 [Coemansia sp. RSA 989]KAJ1872050.1 condensin complex non-SMC subunit Cnd1 [Coemansia sp. RSA 990]KAJ2670939.1 condensin complex non-SMC subunit Cnd1 [Coemansia sp. RSA 1085]
MFNLHEQLLGLQEGEPEVQDGFTLDGVDTAVAKRAINELTDRLVVSGENINDKETFSKLMCFARDLVALDPKLVARGLDMLVAGFENQIKQVSATLSTPGHDPTQHAEALDRYAFLFQWAVERGESTASRSRSAQSQQGKGRKRRGNAMGLAAGSSAATVAEVVPGWKDKLLDLFAVVQQLLQMPLGRVWNSVPERDTFIGVFTRLAHKTMENQAYSKDADFQSALFNALCIWLQNYNGLYGLVTMITQNLQHYEHLSESMASLVQLAYEAYGGTQLADEVLRDIAGKSFSSVHDKSGPKNTARFLVKLSQLAPKALLRQMGLLIRHLDSEAHILRSAMADVIGHLTLYLASQEEQTDIIKNQIGEYFDIIEQRFQDAHYLVRAKVLQVCQFVCSGPAKFPKRRPKLISLIIGRLEDKASNVRKHAIRALTVMLESHPFSLDGAELRAEQLEASLQKITDELAQMTAESTRKLPQPDSNEADLETKADSDGEEEGSDIGDDDTATGEDSKESAPDFDNAGLSPETAAKAMHLQFQQRYYRDALYFVYQLQEAHPLMLQLLGSTSKGEVMEAMDYFVTAVRFRVDEAQEGIRRMSHLIWTPPSGNSTNSEGVAEEARGVRTKLLDSYMQLYLTPSERLSDGENTSRITRNLISLTFGATLAELTSLEELIRTLMNEHMIGAAVVDKLRSVYGYTKKPLPPAQRRGAIIILGMLAQANRAIVTDDIDLYLRIGLGKYGHQDLVLAKYTCMILQCLGSGRSKRPGTVAGMDEEEIKRLPMNNPIFDGLQRILEEPRRDPEWFPAAEQALNAIYALGEKPDALAVQIVRNQAKLVQNLIASISAANEATESDAMEVDEEPSEAPVKLTDPWDLTRLVFIVGHIAIKEIVLLESVEAELKRRKADDEPQPKRRASTPRSKPSPQRKGRRGKQAQNGMQVDSDSDDANDELNQIAGTTEDEIGDIISAIRERELLYGQKSLLALFGPLLVHICKNLGKFKDRLLTVHATAALAKFMCISSSFCEEHLPLLLALLQKAKSPAIRSNVSIALGDITVCFNNLIGENVHYLYGPLHDNDTRVKKTTLMVLTHLILNGMVKVKGQLGEMAKCLEDKDKRVADMARLFFSELATKDNAVYNNLPDIISSLSVGTNAVNEESFARIMKFLFDFIKEKDRQTDNVVEKLCQRMRNTTDARQCRDLAYCMALLPYKSERSVRRLLDGMQCYQHKLADNVVYKHFSDIASKARSHAAQKQETKTLLDEYDSKLKEARAKATGEEETSDAENSDVENSDVDME